MSLITNQIKNTTPYILDKLKNIGLIFDNIFTSNDLDSILEDIYIDPEDAKDLVSGGHTSSDSTLNLNGMWRTLNTSLTGKPTAKKHYFDQLFKKMACCMGTNELNIPVPVKDSNGKITLKDINVNIDSSKECDINGINWFDDQTFNGYNKNCHRLIERYIAFLSKYDPNNEAITRIGGCISNKSIKEGIKEIPELLHIVNANRSCTIETCNAKAYKRREDRKSCATTICNANMTFGDNQAGEEVIQFGNKIKQTCGVDSALYGDILSAQKQPVSMAEEDKKTKTTPDDTEDDLLIKVANLITDTLKNDTKKDVADDVDTVTDVADGVVDDKDTDTTKEEGQMSKTITYILSIILLIGIIILRHPILTPQVKMILSVLIIGYVYYISTIKENKI